MMTRKSPINFFQLSRYSGGGACSSVGGTHVKLCFPVSHFSLSTTNPSTTTTKEVNPYYVKQESLGNVSQFVYDQRRLKSSKKASKTEKYYAVRKGREIGIFQGWENAKGKVLEFPGALFKIFLSKKKAEMWLSMEESLLPMEDRLPMKKVKNEQEQRKRDAKYVLNFDISISRVEDPNKKGKVGLGWILRKYPERELIVAGSELFETSDVKQNEKNKGFRAILNPELPALQALNNGLDEIIRVLQLDEKTNAATKPQEGETVAPTSEDAKKKGLDLPLIIRSDRAYPIGMLLGANPTISPLAATVQTIKSKISSISGVEHTIEHVDLDSNIYAAALAKAAINRIGKGEKKLLINDKNATLGGYQTFLERFLAPDETRKVTTSGGSEVKA